MDNMTDIELQNQEQDTVDNNETKNTEENKDDPKYRGKVLMHRALEHLEKDEMDEFETDRALANKFFDEMNKDEEEMDALYNESRNFGIIYNVIEENVSSLMKSSEGKKSLRKIVNAIKSDKNLHEQFKAFNNLIPSNKVNNISEYINEALSIIPSFDSKLVKESNEKLIKLIKEEKLDEMIDIDDEKLGLYEAVEFVTLNKKDLNNIDEFVSATNVIKENIERLPLKKENKHNIETYADEVRKISESVANNLNSAEMKIIKEVHNGNGEKYFNECKKNTLSKINEMMSMESDIKTKSRLSSIFEKINSKTYNKKTAIVDISEMLEMQDVIGD